MMVYIIDTIEGDIAICECMMTGERVEINTKSLPRGAEEGNVVRQTSKNTYAVDIKLSKERLDDLTTRMNNLFKRDL